ncbi:MAG TPA: hypothetical protein VEQ85_14930, partial [Lacipirellulaceae bacterium]|nr:hypothetical protein [Lacipirellulaceae bacterium]
RRAWADAHPASRIADAPTRDAWAERALGDAEQQLARAQPAEIDAGLRQLEGIASRWQGTSASRRAEELLAEYDSRPDQPWLAVRTQRDQSSRQLEAEASSALAENSRPSTEAEGFPLARARFNVVGDVTLQEGIELMRAALARIGYELRADEEALRAAGAPLDVVQRPRLRAASFAEVDRRFFRRAGVRTVRTGRVIEVLPRTDSRPAEAPGNPPARRPDKTPPAASAPGAAGR